MAELESKEVHEQRINEKKQRNLDRAKAHFAGKIHNDPHMPGQKLEHRLTTVKAEGED